MSQGGAPRSALRFLRCLVAPLGQQVDLPGPDLFRPSLILASGRYSISAKLSESLPELARLM